MKLSLKRKTVCITLLLSLILTITAVLITYQIYSHTMNDHYQSMALNVAETAAAMVDSQQTQACTEAVAAVYHKNPAPALADADAQKSYLSQYEPLQNDGYQQIYHTLEKIMSTNDVLSLSIIYLDAASNTCVYIVDVDNSAHATPMGSWEEIPAQYTDALAALEGGSPTYITDSADSGWLCTAAAPIRDKDGKTVAYALTDVSMENMVNERGLYFFQLCLLLLLLAAVFTLLFLGLVNRAVVNPINRLAQATASFITNRENPHARLPDISIHTGDEVENLYTSFQQMERDINSYIDHLTSATAEKERIRAELDVATRIQSGMLPSQFPPFPDRSELSLFATMSPAKEVGGDFYDFFLVDDDHLALVMADVSGKGIPAALFMTVSKILLKNNVLADPSPATVLEKVNNQLCRNNTAEMFVTVWLGILQLSTGTLRCANAGHEYPILRRAGKPFALQKDRHGFVLAGMEGTRYCEYSMQLSPGDLLFLYTDGVPEATNPSGSLLGTDKMLDALNRLQNHSTEDLLYAMKEEIDRYADGAPQFDDITMLALELCPHEMYAPVAVMKKQSWKPLPEFIPQVTDFVEQELADTAITPKALSQIAIVIDEIFSNIAHYSGATVVTVGCAVEEDKITLRFADNGNLYDPTKQAVPNITGSVEARQEGGLGIFMVGKLVDEMTYAYRDGLNILTLIKKFVPPLV